METRIRMKFQVHEMTKLLKWEGGGLVFSFFATPMVLGPGETREEVERNQRFWTPGGHLELTKLTAEAVGDLEPGDCIYVTVEKVANEGVGDQGE